MNKQIVVYIQWNITQPQKEMKYWYMLYIDEPEQHGAKSKKPDTKGLLYDSIYMNYQE